MALGCGGHSYLRVFKKDCRSRGPRRDRDFLMMVWDCPFARRCYKYDMGVDTRGPNLNNPLQNPATPAPQGPQ